MGLFDFLKRKKEVEMAKEKKSEKETGKVLDTKEKKETKIEKSKPSPTVRTIGLNKKARDFSYNIVKEPHISEKSTNLAEKSKYVFKVYNNVNKSEIKKSVEGIYGVDVLSVNVIKIPAKKRRIGKREGFKKGYRKAIVTIRKGQKIEVF